MSKKFKILCVGPQWRGSNAGGLFRALSRTGHLIEVVDENYYINLSSASFKVKVTDKLLRSWHIKEFNSGIIAKANQFNPDILLVYKGAFILPDVLQRLKTKNILALNFYPDVSFHTHGSLLPKTLPLYHHIFSTKSFGIEDMKEQLGVKNLTFIPHGFDPDVHRPLDTQFLSEEFQSDISFIGTYSEKKASILSFIKREIPNIQMRIWGGNWTKCTEDVLKDSIMHQAIFGDLYMLGIQGSKINLGLLSEKVKGASDGDKITSRTFHIPAAGGFMIHEKNEESVRYFEADKEAVFFDSNEDLLSKIKYYFLHPSERERIRIAGLRKATQSHSLDHRARYLSEVFDSYFK